MLRTAGSLGWTAGSWGPAPPLFGATLAGLQRCRHQEPPAGMRGVMHALHTLVPRLMLC